MAYLMLGPPALIGRLPVKFHFDEATGRPAGRAERPDYTVAEEHFVPDLIRFLHLPVSGLRVSLEKAVRGHGQWNFPPTLRVGRANEEGY